MPTAPGKERGMRYPRRIKVLGHKKEKGGGKGERFKPPLVKRFGERKKWKKL